MLKRWIETDISASWNTLVTTVKLLEKATMPEMKGTMYNHYEGQGI